MLVRAVLEREGAIPDALWSVRAEHLCTDRFRVFAVEDGAAIIAMGSTFTCEHGVILGNAWTHPDHRRRGLHGALLAARLRDAQRLGELKGIPGTDRGLMDDQRWPCTA